LNLELYYYEQCPFCARILRKIDELDLREKIVYKNTLEDPANAVSHQERTGRSTVPCLYINNQPLFESLDIIKWLDENAEKIKA
jgi:glutaredoxin 2